MRRSVKAIMRALGFVGILLVANLAGDKSYDNEKR